MKPGYEQIRNDREINLLIEQGNRNLKVLGYTEHSRKHAVKVAETAGRILKELGYRKRQVEMAKIAGYMHDIGNTVNRYDHAHSKGNRSSMEMRCCIWNPAVWTIMDRA